MKYKQTEIYDLIKKLKDFYEYLGYKIVDNTNIKNKIINCREDCIIYKTLINNIININNMYIIIPYQKSLCPIINNIKEDLSYNNICICINISSLTSIIKETLKINKNIIKIIISYLLSEIDYKKKIKKEIKLQEEILNTISSKILLIDNPYIKTEIPHNIEGNYKILYSRLLKDKISLDYSRNYPEKIQNKYIKKVFGSIYYYHHVVDKIIIINYNNCLYNISKYLIKLSSDIQNKIILIEK